MLVKGFRYVKFPDKKDPEKKVTGVNLYCTRPIESDGAGEYFNDKETRIFISGWFLENRLGGLVPQPGDEVDVFRNSEGKVTDMRVYPKSAK